MYISTCLLQVSDFGLSQVLPDGNRTQVSQKYSGTVTHMPPELIEDGKVYQQGDVYAFGIMMWEVRGTCNSCGTCMRYICSTCMQHICPARCCSL